MQEWNAKSFEKFIHQRGERNVEEPAEETLPRVEKWLQLADQMFSTDEVDPEAS